TQYCATPPSPYLIPPPQTNTPNQKMIKQSDSELAAFIIDIALSDSYVKEILLSRLRSTLLVETASDETREYLELMLQRVSVCH
ncbi:hypothetical protein NL517_30020, partial [Klebsiella pneumoniae]|nr:hypothetical protein [Klebsiella pneumoniae]